MRTRRVRCAPYLGTIIQLSPPQTPYMSKNDEVTPPPRTTTTTITHIQSSLMYHVPPLLQEKLPRLPWPPAANHGVPMLDLTH